jgi:hypothetical protein
MCVSSLSAAKNTLKVAVQRENERIGCWRRKNADLTLFHRVNVAFQCLCGNKLKSNGLGTVSLGAKGKLNAVFAVEAKPIPVNKTPGN